MLHLECVTPQLIDVLKRLNSIAELLTHTVLKLILSAIRKIQRQSYISITLKDLRTSRANAGKDEPLTNIVVN